MPEWIGNRTVCQGEILIMGPFVRDLLVEWRGIICFEPSQFGPCPCTHWSKVEREEYRPVLLEQRIFWKKILCQYLNGLVSAYLMVVTEKRLLIGSSRPIAMRPLLTCARSTHALSSVISMLLWEFSWWRKTWISKLAHTGSWWKTSGLSEDSLKSKREIQGRWRGLHYLWIWIWTLLIDAGDSC